MTPGEHQTRIPGTQYRARRVSDPLSCGPAAGSDSVTVPPVAGRWARESPRPAREVTGPVDYAESESEAGPGRAPQPGPGGPPAAAGPGPGRQPQDWSRFILKHG